MAAIVQPTPHITLHRGSIANMVKVMQSNIDAIVAEDSGLTSGDVTPLPTMALYPESVGNFFKVLTANLVAIEAATVGGTIDMPSPTLHRNSINSALQKADAYIVAQAAAATAV